MNTLCALPAMQLHAAASCQQAPGPTWRPPRASAHLRDRALFKLLPCREAALHAQKANLYKFVRDNAAAYAALPYEPFTRMKRVRFGVPLRVVVSSLPGCVGLRGVVLQHRLVTTKDRELSYYPGLLVTEALHELFSKLYYCPTSLELRALKYREPHEQSARPMLIIGDPTHPGAIINDGVRSGREGTRTAITTVSTAMQRAQVIFVSDVLISQLQAAICQRPSTADDPPRQEARQDHRGRADRCRVGAAGSGAACRHGAAARLRRLFLGPLVLPGCALCGVLCSAC
jgi:hypothetical protein